MTRRTMVRLSIVLFPALACAQEDHSHRNNVAVGFGAAIPVGSTTNYLSAAPLLTLRYGYRFNRFFQADAGFQAAFGAANNPNAEMTDFGAVQGGDHEFTIPLGGRIYIPIPLKRIEISAGGGAAYLHYSETVPSSGFEISTNCYSCTSRGGWGGYGLANARYFLDENHNFHVGATLQFISASTNGSAVANIPPIRTTDHWTNFSFEFGLSF